MGQNMGFGLFEQFFMPPPHYSVINKQLRYQTRKWNIKTMHPAPQFLTSVCLFAVFIFCTIISHPAHAQIASGSLPVAIQDRLGTISETVSEPLDGEALNTFYAARDFRPVWVDETGPTRAATMALNTLRQAGDWGLNETDFQIVANAQPLTDGRWSIAQTADAEIEISSLVLKYARHARGGRIANPSLQLTTYIDRRPDLADPLTVLNEITTSSSPDVLILGYHPQHAQFQKLQKLLVAMRGEQNQTQNLKIAIKGPTLMPGQTHPDVAALNRRFSITPVAGSELLYTPELVAAIKRFQKSVSMSRVDGIIGPATRKALNTAPKNKSETIIANMEQWRWMPKDLGASHIFVNVPEASIHYIKDGASAFKERVIIGKRDTQTPIFSDSLSTIVLRPNWQIPDSIKLNKILSAAQSGRTLESMGYVVKKGSRVIQSSRINWSRANLSAYTMYQPSGGGNALGNVKFLFPNKHSVYLHDTPSRNLFSASERLFSHGCVRVKDPLTFAQTLLDEDRGQRSLDVAKLVKRGAMNNAITLDTQVPIHIGYFTAWVDDDGTASYLTDPYGHQKRITLALDRKWEKIERGVDHLASVDTSKLRNITLPKVAAKPTPNFDKPWGVTNSFSQTRYRSSRNTVGDMIRAAIGN
ncbi:MAG: hypothetical protein CTY31_10075 [Hyphomicrobium sp.]|nr:MAG: hypothetical protein CTY39_05365 [Hyphomicrobium sp.]PPC99311.1 MAG: hypothetical protein CTY31_10075 [Hyphomicrobium sp.]